MPHHNISLIFSNFSFLMKLMKPFIEEVFLSHKANTICWKIFNERNSSYLFNHGQFPRIFQLYLKIKRIPGIQNRMNRKTSLILCVAETDPTFVFEIIESTQANIQLNFVF